MSLFVQLNLQWTLSAVSEENRPTPCIRRAFVWKCVCGKHYDAVRIALFRHRTFVHTRVIGVAKTAHAIAAEQTVRLRDVPFREQNGSTRNYQDRRLYWRFRHRVCRVWPVDRILSARRQPAFHGGIPRLRRRETHLGRPTGLFAADSASRVLYLRSSG